MEIKLFAGDKEIIMPIIKISFNNEEKLLYLCIKNFNKEQQNNFLSLIKKLNTENLFINNDYFAIVDNQNNKIYYFNLDIYKKEKIGSLIITGSYDLLFVFIDNNDIMEENKYFVMQLNGHKFKKL